jgi:hypothetical protein
MRKTREFAIEFAEGKMVDGEWVDYNKVVEWVRLEDIKIENSGSSAEQSINLLTVDSNTRSSRGKMWGPEILGNPSIADVFISNGLINMRGKKGCMLKRYKPGDEPYVRIG